MMETPVTTVAAMIDLAARLHDITVVRIMSDQQDKRCVHIRFAVFWTAREGLGYNLARIGRAVGGRDHSTIHYGLKRACALRVSDPGFRSLTDKLMETTKGQRENASDPL